MKKLILLLALGSLTTLSPLRAQTAAIDTATKNFILNASIGAMQEVVSGQLAAQKAASPEVKAFGNQMVTDHNKAQAKLMQLAKSKGYELPPAAAGTIPDMMLKNATGKDFDRIYVHMMVPDHRKTVLMFQTYAISGKDPDIKAFAQQTLPILKQHLDAITAIDERIKNLSAK